MSRDHGYAVFVLPARSFFSGLTGDKMYTQIRSKISRTAQGIAVVSAMAFFMGIGIPQIAHADARSRCVAKSDHAQMKLDSAFRKHGTYSKQSDKAWLKLRNERQACHVKFHEWWDPRDNKWHKNDKWNKEPTKDKSDSDNSSSGNR